MSRTTLDLDRDLLHALKRLALTSDESMTRAANRVVRAGLAALASGPRGAVQVPVIETFDLGACRVPIDDVTEALAMAEGDWHR